MPTMELTVVQPPLPAQILAPARSATSSLAHAVGKRSFDIIIAMTILIVTVPLLALIALLVRLESPGPVLYRARRVGRGGRDLQMLKFRKMHHLALGAPLTAAEDERFTRAGRFLARTKLDELPQLWHVLTGEMSLIGPRPEHPDFVAERRGDYVEILMIRPGVTGLSQIAFAEERTILSPVDPIGHYRTRIFPQKIRLDLLYASRSSLVRDVSILFWTCAVLLHREVAVDRDTGRMRLRSR
jgi:lipopolysaccharide/colanic/teichoic acid biosynthesis glycosyltransferase